jgi:alpha-amylase/alpha-mannosidase (GH57 family)
MKFVCIHCHFYQPPRENPWLEEVETQQSAYPYHDWNDRINSECYAPNAFVRFEGSDFRSNYEFISFDFGSTLLTWLKRHAPDVYAKILEADGRGAVRFSGHGPAIAHPYYHVILPLASDFDKRTLIRWGIQDFERRFGRKPEGFWLPEMAVNLRTLEMLAEAGIKFVILSPLQASRVKTDGEWRHVARGEINTKIPYVCRLPSGGEIQVIFRDERISNDMAFGGLARNGQEMAERLIRATPDSGITLAALDGETFGHHTPGGDRELARCLEILAGRKDVRLTVPAEYLEKNPPTQEVEIRENSSWSCLHGVERWRNDCGCSTGAHPGWSQAWRAPLRRAMDWLGRHLAEIYERLSSEYFKDPWQARDDYIKVITDRSMENLERFFLRHARRRLTHEERVKAITLLEMEKHAMAMFTSCGWFFDDISDISSISILCHASRAMQLAKQVSGVYLESSFLEILREARSNLPEIGDAVNLYKMAVLPLRTDLRRMVANFALRFLLPGYPRSIEMYTCEIESLENRVVQKGDQRLALGRVRVFCGETLEEEEMDFVALWQGRMLAWVSRAGSWNLAGIAELFRENGGGAVLDHFRGMGEKEYSISELFDEERRMLVRYLLNPELLSELRKPLARIGFTEPGLPTELRLLWLVAVLSEMREAVARLDFQRAGEFLQELRKAGFEPPVDIVSLVRSKLRELLDSSRLQEAEKAVRFLNLVRPGIDGWLLRAFAMRRLAEGCGPGEAEILHRISGV